MVALPPGGLPQGIRAGRVGIVIDDLGWTQGIVQQLRPIDPAIGLAVVPFAPYSEEIAREAHGAGMEVLVHVPMEPHGQEAADPQDGMLLSSMSPADMADQLRRNIEAVPYAVGVNNHKVEIAIIVQVSGGDPAVPRVGQSLCYRQPRLPRAVAVVQVDEQAIAILICGLPKYDSLVFHTRPGVGPEQANDWRAFVDK